MTKDQYLEKIIEALEKFNKGEKTLTVDTKFAEIPRIDSMAIVDFQMRLKKLLGADAVSVPANMSVGILAMTLGDFAELLESLA